MRCRACDKRLNTHEILARNPETKSFEDLCRTCINAVNKAGTKGDFLPELNYLKTRAQDSQGLYVPLSDEESDN